MKQVETYTIKIYVGLKEGYGGLIHSFKEAEEILQKYCNEKSFCVTLDKTNFIYKDGNEPGIVVGIIHYPRFPLGGNANYILTQNATEIALELMKALKQERCSLVCPSGTFMLEKEDLT